MEQCEGLRIMSLSLGKDSTAHFLRMLELGYEFDRVDFADAIFEFDELYDYGKRVEEYSGYKINHIGATIDTWNEWFYGKITRGESEGKVRGMPLRLFPCWWTREAKVKPLAKNCDKKTDLVHVGIAYDEKHRMSSVDTHFRYDLVDWKWTEADCVEYLNKIGMFNPLYVNFDRLGCYHCPKQSEKSLWVLWKIYPHLWDKTLYWDNESWKVAGHGIKEVELPEIQKKFEKGWIPKHIPKYSCRNGCESVKNAFKQRQQGLGAFCDGGIA